MSEQALVEILAMIEQARRDRRLMRVSAEQVQIIAVSYQVDVYKEFADQMAQIYQDYLLECLRDKAISDDEAENLAHLKIILGLNDKSIGKIHEEVVHSLYQKGVDEVIADGYLDDAERIFLEKLQRDLQVPEDIADRLYAQKAHAIIDKYFQYAIEDERLSTEEIEELMAITRSLGVEVLVDHQTQSVLHKYRLYWLIENSDLPIIETDFDLDTNELCHMAIEVDWYEHEHDNVGERLGGFRFFKSSYKPLLDLDIQPIKAPEWQFVGHGTGYITNRHLLLKTTDHEISIDLDDILDVKTYKNGIEIINRSGNSPFLAFETGIDIFLVLLGRAIRDYV